MINTVKMYIDVNANKNLPRISRHDLLSYKLLVKIKKSINYVVFLYVNWGNSSKGNRYCLHENGHDHRDT